MQSPLARLASFVLAGFTFTSIGLAQWAQPDNLSAGPCCTTTTVTAPRAPNFTQESLSICWTDCGIEMIDTCKASFSGPTPPENCRNYAKRLRIKDLAGVVKWNGRINMRYSRTWIESDTTGVERQVWRYLANGDMRPTAAAGGAPCPVPPCTAAFGNKVRYTGYVDYAVDCTGTMQEYAWMLTHSCDAVDHAPGFPRAGAFHPDRTYSFVGPAAGFVVSAITPVASGTGMFEGVRRISRAAGTNIDECEFEERGQHSLDPITDLCLCGPAVAPAQFTVSDLKFMGGCGTTISTPGGPFLPGYLSQGLGTWTVPGTYPGVETLRWTAGGYNWGDPCVGIPSNEVFFGVTTLGGWPARQVPTAVDPGTTLGLTFVDQGNSVMGLAGTTTMNKPYRSTHIINLNY